MKYTIKMTDKEGITSNFQASENMTKDEAIEKGKYPILFAWYKKVDVIRDYDGAIIMQYIAE